MGSGSRLSLAVCSPHSPQNQDISVSLHTEGHGPVIISHMSPRCGFLSIKGKVLVNTTYFSPGHSTQVWILFICREGGRRGLWAARQRLQEESPG